MVDDPTDLPIVSTDTFVFHDWLKFYENSNNLNLNQNLQNSLVLVQSLCVSQRPNASPAGVLIESKAVADISYGSLEVPYVGDLIDYEIWQTHFAKDGTLSVKTGTLYEKIRTSEVEISLYRELWLRMLGIFPWNVNDHVFEKQCAHLKARYVQLLDTPKISVASLDQIGMLFV